MSLRGQGIGIAFVALLAMTLIGLLALLDVLPEPLLLLIAALARPQRVVRLAASDRFGIDILLDERSD